MVDGEIILADEVLTPDSSRFWPLETYSPGGAQPSYDKQFVRDYLESIHWNKQPPAPALPEDVARRTSEKYKEAYRDADRRILRSRVNLLDILLVMIVGASVVDRIHGRIRARRHRLHRGHQRRAVRLLVLRNPGGRGFTSTVKSSTTVESAGLLHRVLGVRDRWAR